MKIFLLFFLCSGLAWLISNLSESYASDSTFDLEFENVPDSLLLANVSKNKIDVKLKANGFQFLNYGLKREKVKLDLSSIQKKGAKYFVTPQTYKKQIDRQLGNSVELVNLDNDTIFFDFFKLFTKEVPVICNLGITLAQNHILEGELVIKPKTITIKGPKNEIDTITSVRTFPKTISDLNSDFSYPIDLVKPEEILNTHYSVNTVKISGNVSKFSEIVIDVPVEVINLPEGLSIQTFPNTVSVLCKAKLDELKNLRASDFSLSVNYSMAVDSPTNVLPLELTKMPSSVYSAQPLETEVEYILKKEE